MISKTLSKLGIILFTTSLFFSCSEFLKGKPAKQETFEIQAEELSCLKDINTQFKKLIHSQSTENEIAETFQCLDKTLSQFQTRVEGKADANSFTAEELFIIFEKFHKDSKVSKEAARNLLVLKQALLGGADDVITKTEITNLRSYLIILKVEVQKLAPYLKLLSFKKEEGPFTQLTIDSGFLQVRSSLKALLAASKLGKSGYDLEDFKKLLYNLNLVEDSQKEMLDIAEKVKVLLVGTEPLKNQDEYEQAIDSFTDAMMFFSYVLYDNIKFEIKSEQQMKLSIEFVEGMVQVLNNSLQFKKHNQIQISSLDDLIEVILNKNILPFKVQFSTFKTFYKTLIIKVFSEQKTITEDSLDALKAINIKLIQKEIALFKLNIDFINSVKFTNEFDRKKVSDLQLQMNQFDVIAKAKLYSNFSAEEQHAIILGYNDFKTEFLSAMPIIYRNKKMTVAVNQNIWDVSWEDMARSIYGKMLGRELVRGWGTLDKITEAGLIQWYSDFKQFAIEVKAFDPRSEVAKTGKETFLQANLFTSAGNGDNEMSKEEAYQYVNMLVSGGNQTVAEIRDGLNKAGCNLKDMDAFGYPLNDEVCFYKDFKANYKTYFSNLSYLVGFLDKLNTTEFINYYDNLMTVARLNPKAIGKIETADIRTLSMTLMYIETLFANYDKNQNWNLSPNEVRLSFPRFKNFVTDYAQKNAKSELDEWDTVINPCRALYPLDSFVQEAFIFLVYNGRLPNKSDVNDPSSVANIYECGKYHLGFQSDYHPFDFKGEVDRKTIISTFKILKTALESK